GYEWIGGVLSQAWLGKGPPFPLGREQNQGYFYVCGMADYIVGGFPAGAPFLNAIIGTLNIFLVYRLARRFFHAVVARRAAALVAYVPSMILWSSIAVKDPIMAFLAIACLSGCVELKRRFTP